MSEVKIIEKIVVDEPQNVEIAIYNLTGTKVDFEIIRQFIVNEKNTMFYLDRKMNRSTDPGYYTDYLWLDTGFRDGRNNPIMICLHNGHGGYVGHYTGSVKELAGRVKSFNKKNVKDIDKNFSRFLTKYKNKAEERATVLIQDPREYAITIANLEEKNNIETVFAQAMKNAGTIIHGSDRFATIIFGKCPHKVVGNGNYSSIIDEFKQREDCPISVDARTESGELKITKQSFRNALMKVYMGLKVNTA